MGLSFLICHIRVLQSATTISGDSIDDIDMIEHVEMAGIIF